MHLNGGPPVASVYGTMIRHFSSDGKRLHLYGGAAVMRGYVPELFVALSFSFAFALACPFAKALSYFTHLKVPPL